MERCARRSTGFWLLGEIPQRYVRTRNFRIECVAYAGDDRASDVLQVANASGRLDEQVDRATGWFLGLGRSESYENLVREDRYLLPRRAIREALSNGGHASRLRHHGIESAVRGVRLLRRCDQSGHVAQPHDGGPRPRRGEPQVEKRVLGSLHGRHGFMEQRGRGWPIMRGEMRAFNGSEPELIHDERNKFVRVRFLLQPRKRKRSTE